MAADPGLVAWLLKQLASAGVATDALKAEIDAFLEQEKSKLPPELQSTFALTQPIINGIYSIVSAQIGQANLNAIIGSLFASITDFVSKGEGFFDDEPSGL